MLPGIWFRNTWAWGVPGDEAVPVITPWDGAPKGATGLVAEHPAGTARLLSDGVPEALFCDNETNTERLWGVPGRSAYPKDGIGDHVVHGAPTVNPARRGTKAALHHVLTVPAGGVREIRLRLTQDGPDAGTGTGAGGDPLGRDLDQVVATRRAEADAFFAALTPPGTERRRGARAAAGGGGADVGQAVLRTTTCPAGWTATRPARRRRRSGSAGATAGGGTSTTRT